MKNTVQLVSCWFLSIGILVFSGQAFQAYGQDASGSQKQDTAKLKEKWTKALGDARRDFQNSNDRGSAEFVGKLLETLDKPDGLSPAALVADGELMKDRVRELIRRGELESASCLNSAQSRVLYKPGQDANGPDNPNNKTGGKPGPDGLVLYMSFDTQDKDGLVTDESGAGNNGRVYGAKWVAEGRFGGAYKFSITNLTDRIVVPNSHLLNPHRITIMAWIKTADKDGLWSRIVDKHWDKGFELGIGGDCWEGKALRGKLTFETGSGRFIESNGVLGDNQWHHVAGTYNGKTLACYIDGVENRKQAKIPGPLNKNTWDLCIGNLTMDMASGEFAAFDGLIDEVRIYNRALSAEEIKTLAAPANDGVTAVTPPANSSSKSDPADRLKQLKQFLDQGLINKEDYDRKVKEIMDSI
jgi:hypothetical protein